MKKLAAVSFMLALFTAAAFAGDPKAGAPAVPTDKKAPDAMKPAAPMEAPKPAKELTDMAKGMAGTWKCKGTASMGSAPMELTGTMTHKLDLDGFWIQSALAVTSGKMSFKFTSYTGYDATTKTWHRYGVDNMGGAREEQSTGMTDGKAVWEGQGAMMGKTVKTKDTEEIAKDGKSVHTVGQVSMDGGKTWNTEHDATCTK